MADKEICDKIPEIVERRSNEIVQKIVASLSKEASELKDEMVQQFKKDIAKDLRPAVSGVGTALKVAIMNSTQPESSPAGSSPASSSPASSSATVAPVAPINGGGKRASKKTRRMRVRKNRTARRRW